MKQYILPVIGVTAAAALFSFATTESSARSIEEASHVSTFEQLDLFADVMAKVRSDYVVNVDDEALIADALNGMLQSLDPHSSYITPAEYRSVEESISGEYGGLGMEVTTEDGVVKVVSPFDDTPADKAGILAGDYITSVDGESILGLTLGEAVKKMRGKVGEPVTLTVVTAGEEARDVTLVRGNIKPDVVKSEMKDGIAYLRLTQFNERSEPALLKALKQLQNANKSALPGIILDLRNNPGGLLDQSVKVSSIFLDGGEVVSIRGRKVSDNMKLSAKARQASKGVPLVVLINEGSASASEIVAGAIQDRGRGLVVGMTSFGKGSVQSVIPLQGGKDGALRLTTQRYYTPAGRSIQGTGIEPDIMIAAAPEKDSVKKRLREADLPNSIENENGEDDTPETVELSIDYPPKDYDEDKDYQLERAIEIFKDGSYAKRLASAG